MNEGYKITKALIEMTPEERAKAASALDVTVERFEEMIAAAESTETAIKTGLADQIETEPRRRSAIDWLAGGRVTWKIEPEELGKWRISRFVVTEAMEKTERLRAVISSSSRGRFCVAGVYTSLQRMSPDPYAAEMGREHWSTVMSDTDDELLDLGDFYREVKRRGGRVLIHGLGLGCALRLALSVPEVEHIDVVEIDPEVIELVGKYHADDPRVTIHEGDAYSFRFPPGTRWTVAWHDVWDDISSDNDFAGLHRRYGGRVDWQGSWCRERAVAEDRRWTAENAWWLDKVNREEAAS